MRGPQPLAYRVLDLACRVGVVHLPLGLPYCSVDIVSDFPHGAGPTYPGVVL